MRIRWIPGLMRVGLVLTVALSVLLTAAGDWPTYLHDSGRTGANPNETIISPADSPQLTELWSFRAGNVAAASPTVVSGTVYAGAWDGYEYALDAASGNLKWKTFVGTSITNQQGCFNTGIGVTSAATVQNGVLYVGGGDAYWYALDATSGAVLWKVFVGDNSASGGHYNWSSPLIYNGYAYIGVASLCDSPLVQGKLLQVSLTSHQIVHTFNVVPSGQVGGSIWSSPSIDPATNTLYVTTGNGSPLRGSSQLYSVAMLALDATTLALKGSWQIPPAERTSDPDWTTTPLLFNDGRGRSLVAAANKDGILFALDRTNVSAGPVWQQFFAQPGPNPEAGDTTVSSGAFDGTTLYEAGNNTIINGNSSIGSVRAFDPGTGTILWQHYAPGLTYPSLAYANGLVVDGAGGYLEVLNAATGARLYSFHTGSSGQIYGLSIANGRIYAGTENGTLYALGLPSTPPTATPTPLPDPSCPAGWSCQDIGNPPLPGSDSVLSSTYTITGSGGGIGGSSDQFRFLSQQLSGDLQVSAQVLTRTASISGTRAGVMVRQSSDPAAPFYGVFSTPGLGLAVQARFFSGGSAITAVAPLGSAPPPLYLQIVRTGDNFVAATSRDGLHFTLVPGSQVSLVMPSAVIAGLAVTSHNPSATSTAVFDAVSMGAPSSPPATPTPPPDTSCPAGWRCADVGNFVPFGSESASGATWTAQSAGRGIGAGADQFHFICGLFSGNTTLSARVITQSATVSSAQAGLMFRSSLDGSAPFYAAVVAPGQGISVVARTTKGYFSRITTQTAGTPPLFLQIQRSGNVFSTATSTDGATWTPVASSTVTLTVGSTMVGGLAVTSGTPGRSSTAMFDSITTTAN